MCVCVCVLTRICQALIPELTEVWPQAWGKTFMCSAVKGV